MERERSIEKPNPCPSSNEEAKEDHLEETRTKLGGILDAADRTLDAIRPVIAEEYLQQNRQRSAQ